MREVYRSDFYVVAVDDVKKLVRATRTSKGYAHVSEVGPEIEKMIATVRGQFDSITYSLLIDVRDGPLRNDPAFEKASAPLADLRRFFKDQAMLIKTATGRLQMARLGRERGVEMHVFEDEGEALAYLLGD